MLPHLLDDVNDINSDFGHTTAQQWQPRTNFAFTNNSNTLNWLLDSRVSHHVTSNLSNVSIHPPYDDSDDIVINDDIGFPITYTCSTSFSIFSHIFYLNNVFCVPTMKNNLISISQFCKSNNASITFSLSTFHVKNLHTGAIFLWNWTKNGVHEL